MAAKIFVKGLLKNRKTADVGFCIFTSCRNGWQMWPNQQASCISLWNMRDIFICKWLKQWIEVNFNSYMILERLDKRQDKPVSHVSAFSLQSLRQSWLSCLALSVNGKGSWGQNQDITGDRKGRLGEDKRKNRADVDWWHWQGESEWGDDHRRKARCLKWQKHLTRRIKALLVCRVLWSEQYSLFHPVCYILSCGSIVFIVVEELPLPGRQGKSRSSLASVNSKDNISWSLSHTIMDELTSIFTSSVSWCFISKCWHSLGIKWVKNTGLHQTFNQ